jgi:hypothetical protein
MSGAIKKFLAAPPAGSRTRAALEYGIDISLTAQPLEMSVDERMADLGRRMDWLKTLQRAVRVLQALAELKHLRDA